MLMDENSRFVTGLDVGTENVRAVIASINKDGEIAVVGYNEGKSAGMRKGVPANLAGPAGAIDKMLGEAERMGGYDVRNAYVSINGSSILSTRTEGMIAVGTVEHEINDEDLDNNIKLLKKYEKSFIKRMKDVFGDKIVINNEDPQLLVKFLVNKK